MTKMTTLPFFQQQAHFFMCFFQKHIHKHSNDYKVSEEATIIFCFVKSFAVESFVVAVISSNSINSTYRIFFESTAPLTINQINRSPVSHFVLCTLHNAVYIFDAAALARVTIHPSALSFCLHANPSSPPSPWWGLLYISCRFSGERPLPWHHLPFSLCLHVNPSSPSSPVGGGGV